MWHRFERFAGCMSSVKNLCVLCVACTFFSLQGLREFRETNFSMILVLHGKNILNVSGCVELRKTKISYQELWRQLGK